MAGGDNAAPLVIGKVGAPYGVKGWLKIHSFTDPKDNIVTYSPWQIEVAGRWQAIEVSDIKQHGDGFIAHFNGYDDREIAKTLTNAHIGIEREQLASLDPGEYYWADLEGLTVIDQQGKTLGTVDRLIETGANDVLIVKEGKKQHMLPYLPGEVVIDIDLENKVMRVNWEALG